MNTEIYISSSAAPPLAYISTCRWNTLEQPEPNFSLMTEDSDCSRAESICHKSSFQCGRSSRKPPLHKNCNFLYKWLPMKCLFPPLLFGPLSGNIMACFSQISLVFEIGEPTNKSRRAGEISPTLLNGTVTVHLHCNRRAVWIVLFWQVRCGCLQTQTWLF